MTRVNSINIMLPMIEERYAVGESVDHLDGRKITKIRDNSIDADQNFTHIIEIIVGEKVVREFINTPMRIDYITREESE